MALVYDNLKGMFKEGKSTSEPKNQSGIMTKQLDALSGTGPEGHSLAYITPEEEKLLQKATGKETITTAYGIPTYKSKLTVNKMIENLKNLGGKVEHFTEHGWESPEDVKRNFYITKTDKIISKLNERVSDLSLSPEKGAEITNIVTEERRKDEPNYELLDHWYNKIIDEKLDTSAMSSSPLVKSLMNKPTGQIEGSTASGVTGFNPNKDYHLMKYLKEKQLEMQSKEPYFPPQP